jgi:secretion/DNA translocation related TadE-like protein
VKQPPGAVVKQSSAAAEELATTAAEFVPGPGAAPASAVGAVSLARSDGDHPCLGRVLVELRRMVRIVRWSVPAWSPVGRPSWLGCDERSADRGAATVWVVGGMTIVMAVTIAVYWLGGAVVARHQAEGAADLGALAAAGTAADGERAACAEARWVVERMGAALLSCRLSGWDALVEADVGYAPFGSAAARARAGPVELDR